MSRTVERLSVDARIGGDDLKGRGTGGERQVPIGKEGHGAAAFMPGIIERVEASKQPRMRQALGRGQAGEGFRHVPLPLI